MSPRRTEDGGKRRTRPARLLRRTAYGFNLAVFLVALVSIAVVVNYFARRPELRFGFDGTKTRAYSLSEQSRQLIDRLDGEWTIALIMIEDAIEASVRHQIDEVLRRYHEASPAISVVRVDPTDPTTLGTYEGVLARLRELEQEAVSAYEFALDDGVETFARLQLFAQQQAGQLEVALERLPAADAARGDVQQRLGLLGLLAREGGKVMDAVAEARAVTEAQPIPDYETARSILAEALSQWANELYEMARIYDTWRDAPDTDQLLARFAASVSDSYVEMSQTLAIAADPLMQLAPLELARIGRQLHGGEAAVVIGPERAAVIPSAQLFPKLNVRTVSDGGVAFDQRFRGEQVISAAIRSILVPRMPLVVFVHSEPASLMRDTPQHADLVGIASMLATNRFDVAEWSVGSTERPTTRSNQAVVWVVVPPMRRQELEPDRKEIQFIQAVRTLIDDGEPVLLNVYPSLLPFYRQEDLWQRVAAPFNLRPGTGTVIFESRQEADGTTTLLHDQLVRDFSSSPSPISGAVNGQSAYFVLPVPIEVLDPKRTDVRHQEIAIVAPSDRRWTDADWRARVAASDASMPAERLATSLPIAVTAERRNPVGDGMQRFMLVGSGGWMLSRVADTVTQIGGGRVVLDYPGNQELMLASVMWLAGLDELIAPSPVSRQVARLSGIDGRVAVGWGLITVIGTPLAWLLLGTGVWLFRRI